ncbi:hypothetical protein C943_00748 [Mariniradius saccharolyticus AK6]|uniref:Uncharacterized protein n=1 Tax=Mariniradius saccharolyticus AK6 TaxID=1239962 RepID=M7XDW3_9BACT|nr:hypothetical protein [Mariniradius saccharolyticus]EMS32743.1 hypothetical protein C943_00748 [Mariniradius saccharolyticus AK6]
MKTSSFRLVLTFLLAFFFSCQEEESPGTNPGTDPVQTVFPTTDVNIVLPTGSTLDLSKTKLLSGFAEYPVENTGKSKVRFAAGGSKLAFLVDEAGNTLLAGFITDTNKEISIATTASVLVYFGMGISFQPHEIKKKYLEGFSTLDGMSEFSQSLSNEFSTSPDMLKTGKFMNSLTAYLSTFAPSDTIDIRAKQIDVDTKGFKSGIQVYELDHQNVNIRNERRRRAHAFTYKTAFKDKEGLETTIKQKIGGADVSEKDIAINPRIGITSFSGTLKEWMMGKIMEKEPEFAMTENGPVNLPMKESESEATYKVRVVGPGMGNISGLDLTNAEKEKLDRLIIETFALDFLVPFIFDVLSMDDALFGTQSDEFKDILWTIDVFVKSSPAIEQALKEGDYIKTFKETIWMGISEYPSKKFDDMVEDLALDGLKILKAKKPGLVTETPEEVTKKVKSALNAIKLVDYVLKAGDYKFLLDHIALSDYLVEFTAKVKADDLVLTPKDEAIVPFTNHNLKVETKTVLAEGETFVFKWSTTGKYGFLFYQNQKKNFFETSNATIAYRSEANPADLSDDANIDTVKVEVFTKKGTTLSRIGDAKAVVNVKKLKLVMKPEKISISGGESIRLYLERNDRVNDIVPNAALDYKVEWETPGVYGKFNGTLRSATTVGNAMNYEALDKDVKEGKETIVARVYFKAKSDFEWTLRETVKGELTVVNDPKKIVLNVPLITRDWNTSQGGGYTAGVNLIAPVPIHEKAVKYTVKIYGLKQGNISPTKIWTWQAGKEAPSDWLYPPGGQTGIVGNQYHLSVSSTWRSGQPVDCNPNIPGYHAFYKGWGGYANVEIEIRD